MGRLSALLLGAATLITLATGAATPALAVERQSYGDGGFSSLPATARATISGVLGRDSLAYHANATADGFRSKNRPHGLVADFDQGGVAVTVDAGQLGLSLRSIGYGTQLSPVAPARPQPTRNRVEYRRGALTEWYVNGPLGLEQGFTLAKPPAKRSSQPLTLSLTLSGTLRPSLAPGATGLTFAPEGRRVSLRYWGLAAWDAGGRVLPARLVLQGTTLLVRVEDAGARYPLTIDPLFEHAKLTASDTLAGDLLGYSVAVSDDTVVVGAPRDDVLFPSVNQGSAYVFVEPGGGWVSATETAKLTASDGAESDFFGTSVAISGDTVLVGADGDDVGANLDQGSAYVFVKPGGGWVSATETAKLTASDGAGNDRLGQSVAVSGDTVVVGAPLDSGASAGQGSAYVFVEPGGGWVSATETAKLTASDASVDDAFGHSVAVSGDTVVVGAWFDNVGPNANQGSAYVFVEPGGGWVSATETAKLTASDGAGNDRLGQSVAVSGDTVVVGAYFDNIGTSADQGSAYVFVEPGGGWVSATETAKLTASDGAGNDRLGQSVAVSGDTAVVGAYFDDVGTNANQGSAYVFVKPGGGWVSATETEKLTASDGVVNDVFGTSVAVSGDTVVVGSPGASGDRGAAYVFREGPPPVQPGFLRVASNPAVATQISIDGVIRESWGLDWLKLAPGTYNLSYRHVEGYTEPAPHQVTITSGQTTVVNAPFPQRGSLRAETNPPLWATISVDGVPRDDFGTWTDYPPGSYQVCFGAVVGFDPPPCQNATVSAGQLTTVIGNYVANPNAVGETNKGFLRVESSPAVRTQIMVDGVIRDSWGLDWLKLTPGEYTLSFSGVEGYSAPAPQQVTITANQTTTVIAPFPQRGSLRVDTNPPVWATISVDGVPRDDFGMWTDYPPGSYQVCFGPVEGLTAPPCQNATVTAGQLTTITGDYS